MYQEETLFKYLPGSAKKLVLILAASTSMAQTKIDAETMAAAPAIDSFTLPLKHLLCIYHQVYFKKNQAKVQTFLDFDSKINSMTLAYMAKPCLKVWSTNIRGLKIDGSTLKTFKIV